MIIRKVKKEDVEQVCKLYRAASKKYPGRLTQFTDEVTLGYIKEEVIQNSLDLGLMLVVEKDGEIIASIKAYTSPYRTLAHVLTNATLMSHPKLQTFKYGATLFKEFLKTIEREMPHIHRFEALPHESNTKAIEFYKKCGMFEEARLSNKIINQDGQMEREILLAWFNPSFKQEKLEEYYKHLKNYLELKYE